MYVLQERSPTIEIKEIFIHKNRFFFSFLHVTPNTSVIGHESWNSLKTSSNYNITNFGALELLEHIGLRTKSLWRHNACNDDR